MTYRVVQWSTGNVGRHALAGIDARPDLELAGVWVSNPAKVGKEFTADLKKGDIKKLPNRLGRKMAPLRARGLISDKQAAKLEQKEI